MISAALAYNLYLKSDLVRVAQAFEVQRIPWLLLKGISLADSLYGGIAHRAMVDNDIVVRRCDVPRAHEELRRLGFVDREANCLELNLAADFQHPMHFDHPDVQTGLELHWHVHPHELFFSDVNEYFERAVSKQTGECTYQTLCPNDRFLHLVTHWVQHGLNKPAILQDLERSWNAQAATQTRVAEPLNLPLVIQRAQNMGAFPALCLALLLLESRERLTVAVPAMLRNRRAQWFFRVQGALLSSAAEGTLGGTKEQRLRVAYWTLLGALSAWRSVKRELLPSRARLSRIVGRELSQSEAASVFVMRQRRVVRKWFGP
jgi:Uncharacterised nucleotidyltransferase